MSTQTEFSHPEWTLPPIAALPDDYEIPTLSDMRGSDIVLFGASTNAQSYLRWVRDEGIRVRYFCDNDPSKWGTFIEGIEVVSPDRLQQMNWKAPIIVCSFYFNDILRQLTEMGFNQVHDINTQDPNLANHYDRGIIYNAQKEIQELYRLLADDQSREVFRSMLQYRLSLGRHYMDMSDDQYFPDGVIRLEENEVFVDCGAFHGDVSKQVSELTGRSLKKVFCFEPDPRNFSTLENTVKKNGLSGKAELFNNAVFDKDAELRFSLAEVASASEITNDGGISVRAVKIDDCVASADPTFIKMDVEGAEVAALEGARQTIERCKPKMAICVYHKPADLWEIPLFIKTMVPDYRLYLRHHSGSVLETVCYAVV